LLVDKSFGYTNLAGLLTKVREERSRLATVVWGTAFSEGEGLRFIRAGAAGVLRKTSSLGVVLDCLRTVEHGNTWMDSNWMRDPAPGLPHEIGRASCRER